MSEPYRVRLARWIGGERLAASVSVRIDDEHPGWMRANGTQLDRTWPEFYAQQQDALAVWRSNPLAKAIVRLTTDHVVGDGITLTSSNTDLQRFINRFWSHPQNHMATRLAEMCSELTRAGELFPVLSFAPDGMSYVRFKPASAIDGITWLPEDYESEASYHEITDSREGRTWPGRANPDGLAAPQIMLHYSINKPIGCTRGESDLGPVITWLNHYDQWLTDRVRMNWAARVFLWFVTVPTDKIKDKLQQWANPPEPGSVIVKDSQETWEMQTPNLQAADAQADGKQLRLMIAAGAGLPLHMLSEAEGTNLATATAQEGPTLRHFERRQLLFCQILKDLVCAAYEHYRAVNGRHSAAATPDLINATVTEIIKADNATLATAGREVVGMIADLARQLREAGYEPGDALQARVVEMAFRFAGEVLDPDEIKQIIGRKTAQPATSAAESPDSSAPEPEGSQLCSLTFGSRPKTPKSAPSAQPATATPTAPTGRTQSRNCTHIVAAR